MLPGMAHARLDDVAAVERNAADGLMPGAGGEAVAKVRRNARIAWRSVVLMGEA